VRRISRFLSLPPAERNLFLRAVCLVCAVRLGLWFLPSRTVLRGVLGLERPDGLSAHSHPVDRLAWAIRAAARYVPRATCLTQALALQWLLVRSGRVSRLHLGAKKSPQGTLEAHAWVECEDRVVIGGPQVQEYVPLAAWKGRS